MKDPKKNRVHHTIAIEVKMDYYSSLAENYGTSTEVGFFTGSRAKAKMDYQLGSLFAIVHLN